MKNIMKLTDIHVSDYFWTYNNLRRSDYIDSILIKHIFRDLDNMVLKQKCIKHSWNNNNIKSGVVSKILLLKELPANSCRYCYDEATTKFYLT